MSTWSDDPTVWEAMEPALASPARLARAEGDVAAILGCARPPAVGRVLDLGCGPGAHAIAFARAGFRVTAVDTSHRLLGRARDAARIAGVEVEWVEADMRSFRRLGSFDLVCSLNASFGFFGDQENRQVLEHVHESLAPSGALLIDLIGREMATRAGPGERRVEVEGVVYTQRRRGDAGWTHLVSDWTVVWDDVRSEFRVMQRLYSGPELTALLESVGFTDVRIAGSLDGAGRYDGSAARLVGLARVPGLSPEA